MSDLIDVFTIELARSSVRLATPVVLAALASVLCLRAGVVNIALEGKVLFGAFNAIVLGYLLGNTYLGIVAALVVGAALGGLIGYLHVRFSVDIVVFAIAFNLLALELTVYLIRAWFDGVGSWSDPSIETLPVIELPIIESIPGIGEILSGYSIIVYLTPMLCIAAWYVVFRTRWGRHLRAAGEMRDAAEAVGISPNRIEITVMSTSGALCALAGAHLTMGELGLFTRNVSNGRGWLGLTASLFSFAHPLGVMATGLFFGFFTALAVRMQAVTSLPPTLVEVIPHVITLVVLSLVAVQRRRRIRRRAERTQPHRQPAKALRDST
jgi:simple sugar transport system permease protein